MSIAFTDWVMSEQEKEQNKMIELLKHKEEIQKIIFELDKVIPILEKLKQAGVKSIDEINKIEEDFEREHNDSI